MKWGGDGEEGKQNRNTELFKAVLCDAHNTVKSFVGTKR